MFFVRACVRACVRVCVCEQSHQFDVFVLMFSTRRTKHGFDFFQFWVLLPSHLKVPDQRKGSRWTLTLTSILDEKHKTAPLWGQERGLLTPDCVKTELSELESQCP